MYFNRRILIDTGSGGSSEYVSNMKDVISANETGIQEVLITHWHADHVGGIPDVLKCSGRPGIVRLQKILLIVQGSYVVKGLLPSNSA